MGNAGTPGKGLREFTCVRIELFTHVIGEPVKSLWLDAVHKFLSQNAQGHPSPNRIAYLFGRRKVPRWNPIARKVPVGVPGYFPVLSPTYYYKRSRRHIIPGPSWRA
jgi:hypothetical protein